eukprot:5143677-Pyramimonas_sp.AAC.1
MSHHAVAPPAHGVRSRTRTRRMRRSAEVGVGSPRPLEVSGGLSCRGPHRAVGLPPPPPPAAAAILAHGIWDQRYAGQLQRPRSAREVCRNGRRVSAASR